MPKPISLPLVCALLVSLMLCACGGSSEDDLAKARKAGAEEQKDKQKELDRDKALLSLKKEQKRLKKQLHKKSSNGGAAPTNGNGGAAPAPASRTSCGDGVTVGPSTSCPFALNVKAEYYSGPPGDKVLDVYSEVTGRNYTMACNASSPHVCSGGNGARVYFP